MSVTVTIKLDERERKVLAEAARRAGRGLSSFVRDLAHEEANRIERLTVRAQADGVLSYLAESAQARAEMELHGTPMGELP